MMETLRAAAHEGRATVLVVSHDPRVVPFADRVLKLEDGAWTDSDATSGDLPASSATPSPDRRKDWVSS